MKSDPMTCDDITTSQITHTIQKLTDTFHFSDDQAKEAVEAVGSDVILACNYILDQGGEDRGGAIVPLNNCPHIVSQSLIEASTIHDIVNNCSHFDDEPRIQTGGLKSCMISSGSCSSKENWMCLHCGVRRCSRYANGHSKEHYESTISKVSDSNTRHCLAISLMDLSIWCYSCQAYIVDSNLNNIIYHLESLKFNSD